ncbi:MAG: BMP family ABC transporter substrate-binding protein, partial [bacterium]|nr:BMP family ABC transporter substrate-binding protein [bacterium]
MRVKTRLLIVLAAFGLLAAACGGDETPATTAAQATSATSATTQAPAGEPISIGLVYDIGGRGDQSFNDAAAAGLDKAAAELGVSTSEASANEDGTNREELLALQASEGADLVIGVGFLFGDPMANVAAEYPDTNFAIVDSVVDAPNVAGLIFSEEQGSFLVGVAAALKSETGIVGYIGGVNIPLIHAFEAGFLAGVQAIDPSIHVISQYVTEPPDFSGFNDPAAGRVIAQSMFEQGADVVYHAAGGTGGGLFQAAKDYSEANNTHVWAIGVDSDQYLTAGADFQPYILTSMLKRVDVAVFNTIQAIQSGTFAPGPQVFDLSVDGVGYSTSGGYVDDIAGQLDNWKGRIVSGEIVVSRDPTDLGVVPPPPATGEPVSVGLVYDIGGRGDQSFNDAAAAGLDKAAAELGTENSEASANEDGTNREELLALQASEGADLVIGVGFLFGDPMANVAGEFPDTSFAIVDSVVDAPNVAGLIFSEEQGSFLVGAAAALKTQTGIVGYIGGVNIPLIHAFEAGFLAGVQAVDPSIQVISQYVTEPPDFSGFNDPAAGRVIAQSMFEQGADVVYHA